MYVVDGILYYWDNDANDWLPIHNHHGPTGPIGPTGPVGAILGYYNTPPELEIDKPKGNQGDAYLVGTDLYV